MKRTILLILSTLLITTGCTKNSFSENEDDTQNMNKVIVEYLNVIENSQQDGIQLPFKFSKKDLVVPSEGGTTTITTNAEFKSRIDILPVMSSSGQPVNQDKYQFHEFKLYIDGVDQHLCTSNQAVSVTLESYPLFNDNCSGVRVPTGKQRKVRYADDSFGFIPDSSWSAAYPIAGIGYTTNAKNMATAPLLISGITGPWFEVNTNVLEAYTRIEVGPSTGYGSTLEERTRYTKLGEVQERFLNGSTTYIYLTRLNEIPNTHFTIKIAPNQTGQPRSFTLGFPYIAPWDGSIQYELYKVTQEQ